MGRPVINLMRNTIEWLQGNKALVGSTAAFLSALVVLWASVDTLRGQVHGAAETVTIRFVDAPAWIGDSLRDHLASTAAPWLLGTSLLHEDLANARAALVDSGCFAEVHQVQYIGLNTVEIKAEFLAPRARIIGDTGTMLIDRHGLVLPAGYRVQTGSHLVTIRSSTFQRPTPGGRHWPGADVAAALSLLDLLEDQAWYDQVSGIDLSSFEPRQQLVLTTDNQSRIIWGSPPGEEAPLEAMAYQKIDRIGWFHENHGRIDQHHRGELDFTKPSVITKQ